jgi:hypothetical protein
MGSSEHMTEVYVYDPHDGWFGGHAAGTGRPGWAAHIKFLAGPFATREDADAFLVCRPWTAARVMFATVEEAQAIISARDI